ncbi:MAG: hypothetical protein IAE89_02310 [Anaerolineae bacterium]|nr:hypothetical protein [Anaerolineae bacterium]
MLRKMILICAFAALFITALAVSAGIPSAPSQQPMPSITPLFSNGQPQNIVPFGGSGGGGFSAQGQSAATLLPGQVTIGPQAQQVVVTAVPGAISTVAPAIVITDSTAQQSDTFLTNLFNNVIVPVINFVLTLLNGTIVTVWNFAGAQGGFLGQALCCIAPAIFIIYWFIFRRFRRRR